MENQNTTTNSQPNSPQPPAATSPVIDTFASPPPVLPKLDFLDQDPSESQPIVIHTKSAPQSRKPSFGHTLGLPLHGVLKTSKTSLIEGQGRDSASSTDSLPMKGSRAESFERRPNCVPQKIVHGRRQSVGFDLPPVSKRSSQVVDPNQICREGDESEMEDDEPLPSGGFNIEKLKGHRGSYQRVPNQDSSVVISVIPVDQSHEQDISGSQSGTNIHKEHEPTIDEKPPILIPEESSSESSESDHKASKQSSASVATSLRPSIASKRSGKSKSGLSSMNSIDEEGTFGKLLRLISKYKTSFLESEQYKFYRKTVDSVRNQIIVVSTLELLIFASILFIVRVALKMELPSIRFYNLIHAVIAFQGKLLLGVGWDCRIVLRRGLRRMRLQRLVKVFPLWMWRR
ncbi:hypothetical protein BCR33DRAFT_452328 [Rhizoclosmatium globosum]|uniref:Uncharacterized protein n=1 Tax=Rhizoclosmatium globosum TaxID=329046 RepID=A0A1Y2CWC0_9FUNG|nr:hypothetical protein BCR33DRAFT_452328 [Rhizoclosmatium globosum]|eukprot:ORY51322.1 hypothetical protein BCR33DRAFT_452328 [Rhizoclosmatium globosum]